MDFISYLSTLQKPSAAAARTARRQAGKATMTTARGQQPEPRPVLVSASQRDIAADLVKRANAMLQAPLDLTENQWPVAIQALIKIDADKTWKKLQSQGVGFLNLPQPPK